ncbi:hypothetical protein [Lysobacter capsici]|uniref:hypothetical protein n=1 Tax=Lysobacter capsici TaxID=435897 RepID=UPI000BBB5673|nr:hypothetical protein [Lysobacter capsici]ATE71038.1 hypothetical protein CNO08_06465 [Lysobacter capsici]
MRPSRPLIALIAVLTCPLWLMTGCKDKGTAADGGGEGEPGQSLPTPEGASRGGVTGMPDRPGPGQIGLPEVDPNAPPALDENGNPIAPVEPTDPAALPVDGTLPIAAPADPNAPPATPAEPSAEDAVAVIRDYYAAINGKNFERAYALWSDGGRASGQTPQQFADGFAETAGVSVEVMPPGRTDAGAGQRYIEVPVAIASTQRDGSQHKYVGAYTLRRAVVDGASDAQRAWRIGSADIREVKP